MYFISTPTNVTSSNIAVTEELLNTEYGTASQEIKDAKDLVHARKQDIWYFRKHSDLHGWLEEKWLEHHDGEADEFNCVYMEITPELLAEMTKYANQRTHTKCQGFFWGSSEASDWKETRKLCKQLKEILDAGDRKVFYYSWW